MDLTSVIAALTRSNGLSGYESAVSEEIARQFAPFADELVTDALYNVRATLRGAGPGPRVLVTAHQDEIGLVVSDIEEDGSLRVAEVGGVDGRILPAQEVWVLARGGALFGVIGAKPPHLLAPGEEDKAVKMENLYVDLGLSPERVRALVRVGDMISLTGPATEMQNGNLSGKTMDDRVGVAAMLFCAERLRRLRAPAETVFVAASQEEVGSIGAEVACYGVEPDFAIALDVTHAETPGTEKWEAFPLNKLTVTVGPNLHPALNRILTEIAEEQHIEYTIEPCGHVTYTDADVTQISREGVPTVLIGLPLRYMHTTVELIHLDVLRDAGRLIALFIDEVARRWGDIKWN